MLLQIKSLTTNRWIGINDEVFEREMEDDAGQLLDMSEDMEDKVKK